VQVDIAEQRRDVKGANSCVRPSLRVWLRGSRDAVLVSLPHGARLVRTACP
jgi:hypothetical protein